MPDVIKLDDKRKPAVLRVLRPEITVYKNGALEMFIPDIDYTPEMQRSLAEMFRNLAGRVEATTPTAQE